MGGSRFSSSFSSSLEVCTSPTCTPCRPLWNHGRAATLWPASKPPVALRTTPWISATPIQTLVGCIAWLRASMCCASGESSPLDQTISALASTWTSRLRCISPMARSLPAFSATTCSEAPASRWMRCLSNSPNPSDSSTASPTTSVPKTSAIWVRKPRSEKRLKKVMRAPGRPLRASGAMPHPGAGPVALRPDPSRPSHSF